MSVSTNLKEQCVAKVKTTKNPALGELQRHPLSEKYGPKMDDDELQGLSLDIKAHRQHEPIILHEGMVLAGWNRYRACVMAGIAPITRPMDEGSDPVAVAFGTNFVRRKLSSVQKAFYGAQFCMDSNQKQADIAKLMACNLNRLNQCCQLLKLETPEAKKAVESLREGSEMGSAQFDELMQELGIARQPKPAPARVAAKGNGALGDDDDPMLGDEIDVDDLTNGQIDDLLLDDPDDPDEASPDPAKRKGPKEVGDDAPIPAVGAKRTSMVNPHETPVSRVAKAFRGLSEAEQRQFVKFTWAKLKAALDAAIGGADVEYTAPEVIKADPSRIARNRKADDPLDDGAPAPTTGKGKKKPAAKAAPPAKSKGKGKPTPAKKSNGGKHATAHDKDI